MIVRKAAITFFGLGYLRPAPGTWGSAGAIAVAGGVHWAMRAGGVTTWYWFDVVTLIGIAISCWLSVRFGAWAIEYYAAKACKPGDPGHFVLDEAAGQWVSILLLPIAAIPSVMTCAGIYALQFFLFRIFDIIKPPPGRWLEKLPAGWGVLLDDIAAGIYANIIGQIIVRLWIV